MNIESIRSARQHAIESEMGRLERRLVPLRAASNRVSWLRAGIFVIGIISGLVTGAQVDPTAGWTILAATLVLFTAVVAYHRRLEHWINVFAIWREMRADQLARMRLDWDKMPRAANIERTSPIALDLDLTGPRSLHQLLDTTISRQGSQALADWTTQPCPQPDETQARQTVVRELTPLSRFRDRFRLTFKLVMAEQLQGENLTEWLTVEFPTLRLRWMLPAAAVLVALSWVLLALNFAGALPPVWVVTFALYAALYFSNVESLNTVLGALVRLDAELDRFAAILRYLETFNYTGHPGLAALCAPLLDPHDKPSAQVRRIKLTTAGIGLRSHPIVGLLINLVLPWDFMFAFLADRLRAQAAVSFPAWLDVCYRLDALAALGNFAYLNPEYTFPQIRGEMRPIFSAQKLGHPLIAHDTSVRNDFTIEMPGEVAIITGSNMAGKSTFIKTVGINLCLAYAGAPVKAVEFRSAPFRLHTCIRIADSVTDGFSYFYAEVRCLKRLLEELRQDDPLPLMYLIDEIFRGTNNRERLLGSRAYIQEVIGKHGVGLLATHDLELANLAESSPKFVHNFHFRDRVQDGKLVFDYQIRPGPSPTTNALKIMQMEGLPVEWA